MFIFKKAIPRRAFLRGVGASIALPAISAMFPALASVKDKQEIPRRFSIIFAPNGQNMQDWTPGTFGKSFQLTPTLQPLAPYKDQLFVLSGLNNPSGDPLPGEGESAPHERAGGVFLTGVHPRREGHTGVSIDQIIAKEFSNQTQLGSLELGLHTNDAVGSCEKGWSCAYISTLSWKTPTTPLPIEYRPRAVFERLFGDSTDPAVRLARIQNEKSILDSVTDAASRMMQKVGADDRRRLTEYLEAMRGVERRIQMAEKQSGRELPSMDPPTGVPSEFVEHLKLMFDLQVLAFQTDITRMITLMMGPEQSNRTYPEIGVPEVHHSLSHHRGDPVNLGKISRIDLYHTQLLAYYLDKLRSTPDVEGSLLDNMMVMYGGSMSDGNLHLMHNLPILLIGGASGKLTGGGGHIGYPEGTPISNLYLTVLDKLGVQTDKFGDSTGGQNMLSMSTSTSHVTV